MGKFISTIFASCLGVLLALAALVGIGAAVGNRIIAESEAGTEVKPNSILELTFQEAIPERTDNLAKSEFEISDDQVVGLADMIKVLEVAREDDNIKGLFLDLTMPSIGRATAEQLRDALVDFQSEGKFVLAYSNYYSQQAYYLASASDQVFVNPMGGVEMRGFATQIPFFKDLIDRLGINMQIYYAGKFKSATEPFRRTDMSPENRAQTREYLERMHNLFIADIAQTRNIPITELDKISRDYLARTADDAVNYGLVDKAIYRDQVYDRIRDLMGLEPEDKINKVEFQDYYKSNKPTINYLVKDKIAVVYAEGDIIDGNGDYGQIGGEKYARILRKLRKDTKIKAIVLRINSPGGSAMASEEIWREITLARQQGIPVVASMGDLAASGGYYIACATDSIFANPNTITGSIGVFGIIPSLQKTMNEKAGIQFDTVKTGNYASMYSPFFDLNEQEGAIITERIQDIYKTFLTRVSEGRNIPMPVVKEIAQGRVYTGTRAKEIDLVDAMGDLDEAINAAAGLAGIDSYRLSEYPKIEDNMTRLIKKFTGQETTRSQIEAELAKVHPGLEQVSKIRSMKGPQMRLPFVME